MHKTSDMANIKENEYMSWNNGMFLRIVEREVTEMNELGETIDHRNITAYNPNGSERFYSNSFGDFEINEETVTESEFMDMMNAELN